MKFLNWIKSSLNICSHEWEDVKEYQSSTFENDDSKRPITVRYTILQRCKKCGKYKTFKYSL